MIMIIMSVITMYLMTTVMNNKKRLMAIMMMPIDIDEANEQEEINHNNNVNAW